MTKTTPSARTRIHAHRKPRYSLAIGQLTGQGKLFTKQEYLALLAILQPAGVIVDLGGNKGNTLTGVGRRLLKRHLKQEVL